ncbi:hypothetical protein TNIN_107181 [Trichonephila inaurata madagascariensis]|uniref:Uncharacterized protein n=1 Tax=Trichonephila inaurata madagascariensis TaxID=2747483 RepID=A0A8X7BT06_9ARAC|nr:hypothetical protein TNIN_107181 [Trichonephila inaurata madagascariensis]
MTHQIYTPSANKINYEEGGGEGKISQKTPKPPHVTVEIRLLPPPVLLEQIASRRHVIADTGYLSTCLVSTIPIDGWQINLLTMVYKVLKCDACQRPG